LQEIGKSLQGGLATFLRDRGLLGRTAGRRHLGKGNNPAVSESAVWVFHLMKYADYVQVFCLDICREIGLTTVKAVRWKGRKKPVVAIKTADIFNCLEQPLYRAPFSTLQTR
jgi:hypothetical protein